jgi:hypothetical protein
VIRVGADPEPHDLVAVADAERSVLHTHPDGGGRPSPDWAPPRSRMARDSREGGRVGSVMPFPDFGAYSIWLNLAIFGVAAAVVWWVGTRLSPIADLIADRTRLGKAFVGLIAELLADRPMDGGGGHQQEALHHAV